MSSTDCVQEQINENNRSEEKPSINFDLRRVLQKVRSINSFKQAWPTLACENFWDC